MLTSIQTAISIIAIISAIPLGLFLHTLTSDEKNIYKKYFTPLLWLLAISSAIFYSLNLQIALTLTFIFILVFVWDKSDKILKRFK